MLGLVQSGHVSAGHRDQSSPAYYSYNCEADLG